MCESVYLRNGWSLDGHVNAVRILDALRPPLLVAWPVDTWRRIEVSNHDHTRHTDGNPHNHGVSSLTSTLAQLIDRILNRSPSVLPQVLFPADFVDRRVALVPAQFAAGVGESVENDGESGAVAEDGWCGADCVKSVRRGVTESDSREKSAYTAGPSSCRRRSHPRPGSTHRPFPASLRRPSC